MAILKEREDALKLKEFRQELEEKILEKLPGAEGKALRVQVEQLDEALAIDEALARRVIEALLFSSSKPLAIPEIRKVIKGYAPAKIQALIEELRSEYEREDRSFRIREIAGGYEISTEAKYAPWIMKMELQKKARQASQSALETLAILAYKQPATRAEVEDLRGVNCAAVLAALLEKGFIKITGRKEVPGRPMLYGTTEKFLDYFGLKSLEDLPNISEIKSLVENSIRKEELIQFTGTVVEQTPQDPAGETPAEATPEKITPPDASGLEPNPKSEQN